VARDRKRAKQRQQRRTQRGLHAAARTEIHRADVPGALEHASGEVDEFDAALVRGAQGIPMPSETSLDEPSAVEGVEEPGTNGAAAGLEPADAGSVESPPTRGGRGTGAALQPAGDGAGAALPAEREHRQRLPTRAIAFLRASWAELQRVQWPDRRQVTQATAVVLGFVAVAGIYLGAADWLAQKIVNFIL
jgi:preprotein translocase subunit SecE